MCVRWGRVKGSDESAGFRQQSKADYRAAKNDGDFDAAARIVKMCIDRSYDVVDAIIDDLIPFLEKGLELVCVCPHPSFDDEDGSEEDVAIHPTPRNALPLTYANFLAQITGATVDEEILEKERVGRTKLKSFERFLWQPSFTGIVRTDVAYILVDDVCTLGGTLAALRS
jgi:hypothetical protein